MLEQMTCHVDNDRTTTWVSLAHPDRFYCFRKGTNAFFFNTLMQRNACANGSVFNPSGRAQSDGNDEPLPFFNSFGNGPNVCVGKNLALLEGHVAVLMAATYFTFDFCDGDGKVESDTDDIMLLNVSKHGMQLKLRTRTLIGHLD
eukprot:scaffold1089_cov153-Amphora_coffeaeformis.AAC.3